MVYWNNPHSLIIALFPAARQSAIYSYRKIQMQLRPKHRKTIASDGDSDGFLFQDIRSHFRRHSCQLPLYLSTPLGTLMGRPQLSGNRLIPLHQPVKRPPL